MKGQLKKILCLLCVLTLLITSTGVSPALSAEAAESDERISTAPNMDSVEREESGLFIMTALEEPDSDPADESAFVPGEEAPSLEEILSDSKKIASSPSIPDGSSADAAPAVRVSTAKVSKKMGETESVWVTISGYPAGAYLQASNSNSKAFSCIWGDWSGTKIPIRITGRSGGHGNVTVSLKNTAHETLAYAVIDVTIVKDNPTLRFNPASLTMNAGESRQVTLTITNHSGGGSISASMSKSSVCGVRWGDWDGWTIPLTVTGKSGGSTNVTVTLYNGAKETLASVTLNVRIVVPTTLSASPASVSVYAGESAVVTVTANGTLSNGDSFKYVSFNSGAFTVSSSGASGKSVRLVIAGKSEGSGTLTVTLNNQSDAKVTIPVTVKRKPDNERVTVAPSSASVKVGASTKVACTGQNVSGAFSLRYTNNAPSILTCAWKDSWSGGSVPITITGKAAGSGSVTIELLTGGVTRSTATIQVTVSAGSTADPAPTPAGASPSYSFGNYSKRGISLALCQFMFGNTQKAKTVYYYDVGNGGVCFGMSATSGMLSASNTPNPGAFGRTAMKDLKKSDYSSTLASIGMSLTDFIEALHISQMSNQLLEKSGVQNMVREVRNGGTDKPVIICMRGDEGGHAILAYGVTANGSLRVYDSNYPLTERAVNISGENWSYDISSGIKWNQSNAQISYVPYDTYYNIWNAVRNNQGKLSGVTLQDGTASKYLLATTADDFSLVAFADDNYEREVAVYEGGVLKARGADVQEVFVSNVPLDTEERNHLHMLYVPEESRYAVYNRNMVDGKRLMDVTLSGDGLSVHVNSEAEKFVLAVSDNEKFAAAMLNGLEEGERYSISVGSSLNAQDAAESVSDASIEGYGNGQSIALGIGEGLDALGFDNADGLCIAGGEKDASMFSELSALSLRAMENEDSAASDDSPFTQDFVIRSAKEEKEYQLTAEAGEGGKILPEDGQTADSYDSHKSVVTVSENGARAYRIQPEAGYALKAIYVNGVQAAYSESGTGDGQPTYSYCDGAYEYTFRDVTEQGYLYAEFAKNISACQVTGGADGGAAVTVTDGDKVLLEGVDYAWSFRYDGEKRYLVVQALAGSDYDGVFMTEYDDHATETPTLNVREYNQSELILSAGNVENPVVVAAAYERDGSQAGKMAAAFFPTVDPSEKIGGEIVIRISLQDAGLPENYLLKAFLVSDTGGMRILCDPVEIRGGG